MFKMNIRERDLLNERGQVAVIVALLITAIIGMVALVVDVGSIYEERRQLQTVADAAALAGAQDLPVEDPINNTAVQKAVEYASSNGVAITSSDIQISTTLVDNDTITVTPKDPNAPVYFAQVFGINSVYISATAAAEVRSPSALTGLMPWTVLSGDSIPAPEGSVDMWVGPNEMVLDPGPDYVDYNWFTTMQFGNIYAPPYEWNIRTGCTEEIRIAVSYPKEPDNKAEATYDEVNSRINGDYYSFEDVTDVIDGETVCINEDCPRIVLIPVTDSFEYDPVQVTGFAIFYIQNVENVVLIDEEGNEIAVVKITGQFIDYMIVVSSGETTGYNPYVYGGIKVIRLIE